MTDVGQRHREAENQREGERLRGRHSGGRVREKCRVPGTPSRRGALGGPSGGTDEVMRMCPHDGRTEGRRLSANQICSLGLPELRKTRVGWLSHLCAIMCRSSLADVATEETG